MNLERYIRDRFEDAVEERHDAECRMAELAEQGEDFTAELRMVAQLRAVTLWWERAAAELDQGVGAFDALWRLRGDARRTWLSPPTRRPSCPFARGFAEAEITGATAFYDEIAHVQQLTPTPAPAP